MDAMDIMKLAGGICGGVLVKNYAAYKKWINKWYNNKILWSPKGNKIRGIYPSLGSDQPVAVISRTAAPITFQSLKYR